MSGLTLEEVKALLDYSPLTGQFVSKRPGPGGRRGSVVGFVERRGYVRVKVNGRKYFAHRLAWFYVHGHWPKHTIDHVNGDKSDNRIANLRDVSTAINCQNLRRANVDNKTGRLGVSTHGNKFKAGIKVGGRLIHLGTFPTPDAAHHAYVIAKRALHQGCTL